MQNSNVTCTCDAHSSLRRPARPLRAVLRPCAWPVGCVARCVARLYRWGGTHELPGFVFASSHISDQMMVIAVMDRDGTRVRSLVDPVDGSAQRGGLPRPVVDRYHAALGALAKRIDKHACGNSLSAFKAFVYRAPWSPLAPRPEDPSRSAEVKPLTNNEIRYANVSSGARDAVTFHTRWSPGEARHWLQNARLGV